MTRLHLDFGCGSLKLAGTLDNAPGTTGLLIVSGGNEIRSGAFSGQASLAHTIARKGFPTFRFDRRGIGDSEGENRGFRKSEGDIESALKAFRALAPQIERVIGFGNCDAASALMLMGGAGFDGLVLSNPWTFDSDDDGSALGSRAIRARYSEKLRSPAEIGRLLSGGVNLRKLAKGLLASVRGPEAASTLADEMRAGIAGFEGRVAYLLAMADRTAQAFESRWDREDPRVARCQDANHAYSNPEHRAWLVKQLLAALRA